MAIHIDGVPEYITRDDYFRIFALTGFGIGDLIEVRMAPGGIHALVWAKDENNEVIPTPQGLAKHRVYIPLRENDEDVRTTKITEVTDN